MLYLICKSDKAELTATLSVNPDNVLCLNDVPFADVPESKNWGKQVTVFKDGFKEIIMGKGIQYDENYLLMPYRNRPQTPSFFNGLEDIIKPDAYRLRYCKYNGDLFLFFYDTIDMELFLHDRVFPSQFFFNDKNDKFNCSIFQARSEIFLTNGIRELVCDVFAYAYSKLTCEGASKIEQYIDEGKHIVTQTLYTDSSRALHAVDLISTDTDTYRITFPGPGEYYIQVVNDNFYPMKTFTKVIVL